MKTVVDLTTALKTYFTGKDTDAKQAVEAVIAPVETNATSASKGYTVGEQLILNDTLYDVTATITASDALVVGTNIAAADSITDQLATALSSISGKADNAIIDTDLETIGSAAINPHADGTVFFATNGRIYKATTDIAASDTLTVGTNCALDTVIDLFNSLNSAIANKQDATLATARIIGGTSRTTVEGALGALTDANYLEDSLTSSSATKALTANQGLALANKHKITTKTVSTSGWANDTTSQSGVTLKKKSISLSHVYVDSPSVDIGTSTGTGLPTSAQQAAYDLLQYVTVDGTTMYLYASDTPTTQFYIQIEGVD